MYRTYSEMILLPTFIDRYNYLRLDGTVGVETFGFDRYLNQSLYLSKEWKSLRNELIIRDNACDLASEGFDIHGKIIIHHINPITKEDLLNRSSEIFNPDNLVCVSFDTHNAIHYGDANLLPLLQIIERTPNDTIPWRQL